MSAFPMFEEIPLTEIIPFYRQMEALLRSGVPLVMSLTTLGEQTNNGRLKSILSEAARVVSSGYPFSSVMDKHPNTFTLLQRELIRAGETSGMFELMCRRIAEYLEREQEIRRKLRRETLYPKIVLFFCWLVGGLLIFLRSGGGFAGYAIASAVFIGGSVFLWWLTRVLLQNPSFASTWDSIKMAVPGAGDVSRKYATARFCRALGTLYAGGVLLTRAVEISARVCGNRAIGERMEAGIPLLMQGHGLGEMLARSGALSPVAVQMARTGEQTGSLDSTMQRVADYLEGEADVKSHQLAIGLGVFVLLVAGIIVAIIAISFYAGQVGSLMNDTVGQ
jgi:general secretion pathway protein F/type IV pilus assembly protein PilC